MHVVFKGDLFEIIGCRYTKNWMVLCELHQEWFQFVTIYKTCMPHVNVMDKLQWEGIQLCDFLEKQDFLVMQVEYSSVIGWCIVKKGGRPGALILLVLIWWIHAAMDFSYWSHMVIVR